MNARDYKIFRLGHYYHVFNRGNNKEPIFFDSQDFFVFLNRLKLVLGLAKVLFAQGQVFQGEQSEQRAPLLRRAQVRIRPLPEGAFSILCYCLMPNHFHFLIRQNSDIGIDKLMAKVCTSYAKYFNIKYKHIGNVFQDRFKAKLIDSDSYLKYLSAYIHNNPDNPLTYAYSSFPDYVLGRKGKICNKEIILGIFDNNPEKYKKFVLGFTAEEERKLKDILFEE